MTSGRWVSIQWSTVSLIASKRRCNGSSAGVRTTSTSSAMICLPRPLSTTDSPQRVSPGSTPITRTRTPTYTERLFDTLAGRCRLRRAGHAVKSAPSCWLDGMAHGEHRAPQGMKVRSVGARVDVRDDDHLGACCVYRPEVI